MFVWVVDVARDVRDSWPKLRPASGNGEVSWLSLCAHTHTKPIYTHRCVCVCVYVLNASSIFSGGD